MKPQFQYVLDSLRLRLLLRFFYGTLVVMDFWVLSRIFWLEHLGGAEWLWPVTWLNLFSGENQKLCLRVLFVATVLIHGTCVFRPFQQRLKVAAAFLLFLAMAATYSFGKIDHELYGFLFASMGFAGIKKDSRDEGAETNRFLFWAVQVSVLGTYALNGLWKLRELLSHIWQYGIQAVNPLLVNMSWNSIENFQRAPAESFFENAPWMSLGLWIVVLAFELLIPWISWRPSWQRAGGVFIIVLHLTTGYFMGIYYIPAALLAALIFCNHPYVRQDPSI